MTHALVDFQGRRVWQCLTSTLANPVIGCINEWSYKIISDNDHVLWIFSNRDADVHNIAHWSNSSFAILFDTILILIFTEQAAFLHKRNLQKLEHMFDAVKAIKNQFGLKLKVWKSYNYVISQKIGLYRVPEIDSNSTQWMSIKNQFGLFSTIDVDGIKRNYSLETVKSAFQNKNCRVVRKSIFCNV